MLWMKAWKKQNASKADPVLIPAAASSLKTLTIRVYFTQFIWLLIYAPKGKMKFRAAGVIFQSGAPLVSEKGCSRNACLSPGEGCSLMMPHVIALWHGSSCPLGYSVFVRGWAHRVVVQTNSSRNPLHQQSWNSHICDVFEPTQARLFFLLPPSTTVPSALPLLPIPLLCATSSSRKILCTNTHSALLSLKITSQTEKKKVFFFCQRMVAFRVYTMWGKKRAVFTSFLSFPYSS